MKQKREKRKERDHDNAAEEEEPEIVATLQPAVDPLIEFLWNRVLALEANTTRQSGSPHSESRSPPRYNKPARRERSRSPRKEDLQTESSSRNHKRRDEYDRDGYGMRKGGKEHEKPHSPPSDDTCRQMWDRSYCSNKDCHRDHGISAEDPSKAQCYLHRNHKWCHFLWTPTGCSHYHGREKNG